MERSDDECRPLEVSIYVTTAIFLLTAALAWVVVPRCFPGWAMEHLDLPTPTMWAIRSLGPGKEYRIRESQCLWNNNQDELRQYLKRRDSQTRLIAILACQNIDMEPATRTMITAIAYKDPLPPNRYAALRLLLARPHPGDMDLLLALLHDRSIDMRIAAESALAKSSDERALVTLLTRCLVTVDCTDPQIIHMVAKSLSRMPRTQSDQLITKVTHRYAVHSLALRNLFRPQRVGAVAAR